eukprot:TRINITY_DN2924_c0_g4_i1.p1 TRINITY_DN2924_c0_g4~~TRINITY_DN2924_c0_g4_i1.p1  ORF type:complete len:994 (+),score=463.38 TRINITY_DN2924_c0_g4_i1:62-3043(+)
MQTMSSVTGLLALLKDDEPELQASALIALLARADDFWNEISDSLGLIEELYETPGFPERKNAALLLSQVYYHLGEYQDAFIFALGAGDKFDMTRQDSYTHTIIRKFIDRYCELRGVPEDEAKLCKQYDELDTLFTGLVNVWIASDEMSYAQIQEHVGVCIATRRLDLLEKIAKNYISKTQSADVLTLILKYATHVENVGAREDLLRCVVKLCAEGPEKLRALNHFETQQCLIFLNDPVEVCKNLVMLLEHKSTHSDLIAYQLAFDLFDHCNQDFLYAVAKGIKAHLQQRAAEGAASPPPAEGGEEGGDAAAAPTPKPNLKDIPENFRKLSLILTGAPTTELQFQFLFSQNNGSIQQMTQLKKAIDVKRNAVTHNAAVMANSILFCGTTCDKFLRENLEWLGKATNWSRFTATATLGVINKGHVTQSMHVLKSYLPSTPASAGARPYQEGGALYGLGLIHAPVGCNLHDDDVELIKGNAGEKGESPKEVLNFMLDCVKKNPSVEQITHGGCLGIGLAAMSSKDGDIYERLKQVLYTDSAVSGEAAAIAIGLVYLGSGNARVMDELLSYGKDTQHEKIIRGVSMSLALLMYGREGHADTLIEEMLCSTDPWIRLGGVQVLGSAYAGTGNRRAIERLLTVAVQDTSDDVRRAGILEVGFVTFKEPHLCVNVTSVFADSHSPHIRWGVASALGVAAAGTGNKAALDRLWVLKDDTNDFVRQGAIVSIAMVLMQRTAKDCPRVKDFRADIEHRVKDKYEDVLTKFGAILATSILDAGGKNQTICLHKNGHNLVKPIVGLKLFMQNWYWYPFVLMFSLALQPICMIALNKDLKMPMYSIRSDAPPSLYGIPKKEQETDDKERKKREKVQLSTTEKTDKRKKKKDDKMDVEEVEGEKKEEKDEKKDDEKKDDEKKEPEEPKFEILSNPARVTPAQLNVLSFAEDKRYSLVKPGVAMGCVLVKDNSPDDDEELVPMVNPQNVGANADDADEPGPPDSFEWP